MNFEIFEPTRSSEGRGVPTLRALSGGRLVLNAAAQRLLGDVTFVQLLWDATTGRIGIKPTTEKDHTAFRVTAAPSQSIITSKDFIVEHKIPTSQRMRIGWDDTMWIASTKDPNNPLGEEKDPKVPVRVR